MQEFYKKSKGNAGLDGVQFQVNLLTVFLLNALRSLKGWRISTENEAAGKFDDVIIEYHDGSAVLLQAKHKDNKRIYRHQLFSDNYKSADFSLPKYFLSFQEIKRKFTVKSIIICTNADVDQEKLNDIGAYQSASPDNILYYDDKSCTFIKFNENILSDFKVNVETYYKIIMKGKGFDEEWISHENIKEFLEKLQFFGGYPSGDNLHKIIDQLWSRLSYSKLWSGTTSKEITNKVEEWFKCGRGEYLTETRAIAMFCEIKTNKYCKALKNFNVSLKRNVPTFKDEKNIFHVTSKGSSVLQAIKVYHSLQDQENKILYIDPDDGIHVLKHAAETFRMPKYVFFVLISFKIVNQRELKPVCSKLKEILGEYKHKKVILVEEDGEKLVQEIGVESEILEVDGSVTFQDLTEDTRNRLVTKNNINFQGVEMSLADLIEDSAVQDYSKAIDVEVLERLIRNEKVEIGAEHVGLNEDTSRYYVERTFERDMGLQYDMMSEKKIERISEADIFDVKEKVILISDSAGTGKSTVLAKLAGTIKERNRQRWVIRIELNNYSRFLRDALRKKKKTVTIAEMLNSDTSTKLTKALDNFVFSIKGKVVLMLDGFDEISPDYTDLILILLKQCKEASNLCKVIVTTRPNMDQELSAVLNVKPFVLYPFTKSDQTAFLTTYWVHNLGFDDTNIARCEKYCSILIESMASWFKGDAHFTAIPLQVKMLAEIFEENLRWSVYADWEGCKEFLQGDEKKPKLPETMKISELYDMFMEKKLDIFIDKANPTGTAAGNHFLSSHFKDYTVNHQSVAIGALFKGAMNLDDKFYNLFSHYRYNIDMETDILKIGIVQRLHRNLSFFHRTFAEYFVSKSIVEISGLVEGSFNQDVVFQQFFIDEILCKLPYTVVRAFLESVLEDVVDTLSSKTFENYKRFVTSDLKSRKCRSELIHTLAGEGCASILRLILKCVNFSIVKHKEINIAERHDKSEYKNTLDLFQSFVEQGGVNLKDEAGCTPLRYAATRGRFNMTKLLVELGAHIDTKDADGWTPLHLAAQGGYLDTINFLIENGAHLNPENNNGFIPLHSTARGGHGHALRIFLELGADVNAITNEGVTAMHIAAEVGHLDYIKLLIENGVDMNVGTESGTIPLHSAAAEGHPALVEFFLQQGVDSNAKNCFGITPLYYASRSGHLVVARILVDHGADVKFADVDGFTPLHAAASGGQLHVVEYLVGQGADTNATNNDGFTPLHAAATTGHLPSVKFLVEHGDATIRNNIGVSPLHSAAGEGHLDTVRFLVESGMDIGLRYRNGITPLHVAAKYGTPDVVLYLLGHHVDINAVIDTGATPLHVAAAQGRLDNAKVLLEHGADVKIRSKNGETPLFSAAANGRLETVKFLVQFNNANSRNSNGFTALHAAVVKGHLDTVRFLVEYGVDVAVKDGAGFDSLQIAQACGRSDIVEFFMGRCNLME